MTYPLRLAETNHTESEIFELGYAAYPSQDTRLDFLSAMNPPEPSHNCMTADHCYSIDVLDTDGWTILDSIEVSAETAHTLLGLHDFEPLRRRERAMYAAAEAFANSL